MAMLFMVLPAFAGDNGQWENSDPGQLIAIITDANGNMVTRVERKP